MKVNTREIVGTTEVYNATTDTIEQQEVICVVEEIVLEEPTADEILNAMLGVK